jgi:hypothetical protein
MELLEIDIALANFLILKEARPSAHPTVEKRVSLRRSTRRLPPASPTARRDRARWIGDEWCGIQSMSALGVAEAPRMRPVEIRGSARKNDNFLPDRREPDIVFQKC